jgi:hypothetical protein
MLQTSELRCRRVGQTPRPPSIFKRSVVFALFLFSMAPMFSCGGAAIAKKTAQSAHTASGSATSVGLPRSTDLVARVNVALLRQSSLFPAFVSSLRLLGFIKTYVNAEKACGLPLAKLTDDVLIGRSKLGWVLLAKPLASEEALLACFEKVLRGDRKAQARSVRGDTLRAHLEGDAMVLGEPAAVQAALEASPNDVPPLQLGEHTVLAIRGDLSDLTIEGTVDASPVNVGASARVRFPSSEQASLLYERLSKARASALDNSERSLSKDVLRSIRFDLRGTTLDVRLGTDGDIVIQERYLDVLLGLFEVFLREQEK